MNKLKKATILIGAITGGVLGGSIDLVGKMTKVNFLSELGEGIVDSALLTGEIVGGAISGTADMISGTVVKDSEKSAEGTRELEQAGKQVLKNAVTNIQMMADNSGEMINGIRTGDKARTISAAKTLAKMATIGVITVGAIKLKKNDEKSDETKDEA
jgi:hypothetical protein